jgi:hypothetical protein
MNATRACFSSSANFPRAPSRFLFAQPTIFVALFDVFRLSLLLVGVFGLSAAWHGSALLSWSHGTSAALDAETVPGVGYQVSARVPCANLSNKNYRAIVALLRNNN